MYCVLLVAYSLMAADRYLFPFLNSDVRKEFGFSVPTIGLLSTIFTLGLGIGGLPTGYLLSRFSRKTVLMLGIAIFSGATMLTTVAAGFWTMLLCLAVTASAWPCWRHPCLRSRQAISSSTARRRLVR